MGMFDTKAATVDFHAETKKLRESDAKFDARLRDIVQADNKYQDELCARGGTRTSSLTAEGEEAAQQVIRARDEARTQLARSVAKTGGAERERLARQALESAKVFLADRSALAVLDHNLSEYFRIAAQEQQPSIAGADADAAAFIARAERILAYQQTTVGLSDTRSPEAFERLRAARMLLALGRRRRSGYEHRVAVTARSSVAAKRETRSRVAAPYENDSMATLGRPALRSGPAGGGGYRWSSAGKRMHQRPVAGILGYASTRRGSEGRDRDTSPRRSNNSWRPSICEYAGFLILSQLVPWPA